MNRSAGTTAVILGLLTATIPTFFLFQAVTYLFVIPLVLGAVCMLLGIAALQTEARVRTNVGWTAVVLAIVSVVLPSSIIAYYDRAGPPVIIVVPQGYRGPVTLVIDKKRGIDVPLENGRFTYHMPEGGRLLIRDDSPFRQWHSENIRFADGTPIPDDVQSDLPSDKVAYFSLGGGSRTREGKSEEYIEGFVGTQAELRKYGVGE